MTTHLLGDSATLTGRSLKHITRSPDTIITTVVVPIAFMLLFVYVFGGAIAVPGVLVATLIGVTELPSELTA